MLAAWLLVVFVFMVIALFLLFGYVLQDPSATRQFLLPNISFDNVTRDDDHDLANGVLPQLPPLAPSRSTSPLLPLYDPETYARWLGTSNGPRVFIFRRG